MDDKTPGALGIPEEGGKTASEVTTALATAPVQGEVAFPWDKMKPLSREGARMQTAQQLVARQEVVGAFTKQCTGAVNVAIHFYRDEILDLKRRYKAKEKPVPGCDTFKEAVPFLYGFSYSYLAEVLRGGKKPKPQEEKGGKVHPPPPWGRIDGTKVDVVFSAAHKCVRRGNEADAIAWIRLLHLNGFRVWKQLKIYAMEDIGLADTSVLSRIGILEEFADEVKDSAHHPELLAIIEAVMILCRAKKSRATDDAAIWFQENPTYVPPTEDEIKKASEVELVTPPVHEDYLDKHTAEGRHNGRGLEDFKKTENEALANKADVAAFVPPLVDVTDAAKAQIEYLQKRIKSLEKENASLREELGGYAVAAAP